MTTFYEDLVSGKSQVHTIKISQKNQELEKKPRPNLTRKVKTLRTPKVLPLTLRVEFVSTFSDIPFSF